MLAAAQSAKAGVLFSLQSAATDTEPGETEEPFSHFACPSHIKKFDPVPCSGTLRWPLPEDRLIVSGSPPSSPVAKVPHEYSQKGVSYTALPPALVTGVHVPVEL